MRDGTKTKESIDRRSLRLFVEKGVAETTIRDIASAAGIADGTMYRNYVSKDELDWSLFSKNFIAFSRELGVSGADDACVGDKAPGRLDRHVHFFAHAVHNLGEPARALAAAGDGHIRLGCLKFRASEESADNQRGHGNTCF